MTIGPLTDFLPAKTDIIAVWIWVDPIHFISLDLYRHFITGNFDYGLVVGLKNGFELYFYYEFGLSFPI